MKINSKKELDTLCIIASNNGYHIDSTNSDENHGYVIISKYSDWYSDVVGFVVEKNNVRYHPSIKIDFEIYMKLYGELVFLRNLEMSEGE